MRTHLESRPSGQLKDRGAAGAKCEKRGERSVEEETPKDISGTGMLNS